MKILVTTLLLFGVLSTPGAARVWPDCLNSGPKKTPVSSFSRLKSCQKKAKRRLIDRAEAKAKPLSTAELDSLDAHQRAEARRFLAQPNIVVSGPPLPQNEAGDESAGQDGTDGSRGEAEHGQNGPGDRGGRKSKPDRVIAAAASQVEARFHEAGIPEVPSDAIERLKFALTASGGRITPDIDRQIDAEIQAARHQSNGNDSSAGDDAR